MIKPGDRAELYLDDKLVGIVVLKQITDSWHFGEFSPLEGFSQFAPRFARWSLLMHEDEDHRLSNAASEELRAAEQDLHRIRAKLFVIDKQQWRKTAILTIDGTLIEWKEF